MDRRADPRKWVRLAFCAAFYMIVTGLVETVLSDLLDVSRPEKALLIPSLVLSLAVGWFYTFDRAGNRLAEAAHLAGAVTALRLWVDLSWLQPASGLAAWDFFTAWWSWGSYLGNAAAILLAGRWMEMRRA